MTCARCASPNFSSARFGNACGARLEDVCPMCQHGNAPGGRFCNHCGAALPARDVGLLTAGPSPETWTPKHLAERILGAKGRLEGERNWALLESGSVSHENSRR